MVVTKGSTVTRRTEVHRTCTDHAELCAATLLDDGERDRLHVVGQTRVAAETEVTYPLVTAGAAFDADFGTRP